MSLTATVSNISRCSLHDGPGVRTVIYFTGCALNCLWCHNPETIAASGEILFAPIKCVHCGRCIATCPDHHKIDGNDMVFLRDGCEKCGKCVDACPSGALSISKTNYIVEELLAQVLKEKHYFLQNGGVTLSGGECLLQADFCAELLQKCQEQGIHTAIETALFVPWKNVETVLPFCDFIFADCKIAGSEKHKKYTGQDNGLILSNLQKLVKAAPGKVTIRIPLIPGVNDSENDLLAFAEVFKDMAQDVTGIEILRYNNLAESKYTISGKDFTDFGKPQTDEILQAYCQKLGNCLEKKASVYCTL